MACWELLKEKEERRRKSLDKEALRHSYTDWSEVEDRHSTLRLKINKMQFGEEIKTVEDMLTVQALMSYKQIRGHETYLLEHIRKMEKFIRTRK